MDFKPLCEMVISKKESVVGYFDSGVVVKKPQAGFVMKVWKTEQVVQRSFPKWLFSP